MVSNVKMIRVRNEIYWLQRFQKSSNSKVEIENSNFLVNWLWSSRTPVSKVVLYFFRCAPALRVSWAGTRLTVHRPIYIRKVPQLVAGQRGRATIGAPDCLFAIFVVVFNVKCVGGFQWLERLCSDVSLDGRKSENHQGSKENLFIIEVSKIVKFQGQT